MTDPLTDLVGLIRPRAVLWKRIECAGRWAIRFPADSDITFGTVTQGGCYLLRGDTVLELSTGDFLLLCGQSDFSFASDPRIRPMDGEALLADSPDNTITIRSGTEDPVRLVGGNFLLDAANSSLVLDLAPDLVHLRGTDGIGRIAHLLDLISDEAAADRPGGDFVLTRLVEIMLVEALRGRPTGLGAPRRGLLSGLSDPPIAAALRAVHGDVRRAWTVADLAATAHLSRSVFAARFADRVGATPMSYLLEWRMALAKDALGKGDRTIDEVAHSVGYGSASAFSTAFHRVTGFPPGRYAAQR
ncbi:AraC family transcriptional regulator [Nocardia alni]|uniref:AraC family transcriptional regulator n=1 Tax=Nocardia alni TaxID=2815723 RepID=UPI001C233927|nr:AraC family transcriptional regulator [Nocardia alni]